MSKPIIAVFGATGAQGGSVVRHLVAQGRFGVRGLTRRPEVYAGPADEAVRADRDDPDSLSNALKGAHGVFLVTDIWQAGTAEQAQATTAVAAARASGVEHLVWSSLPDVSALTNGRRKVPHFTGKARVKPIIQAAGFPSYTFAQPPFYFENLSGMMGPQSMPDGRKGWVLPIDPEARVIHMGSVADFGMVVAGAFADPARSRGQTLSMAAGRYSFSDVMRAWSDAVLSGPEYLRRLQKRARAVHDALGEPAILAVQEAENLNVLAALVDRPEIQEDYSVLLGEGPDERGLDQALLYQADHIQVDEFQASQTCTALVDGLGPDGNGDVLNPQNSLACDQDGDQILDGNRLFSRPPLVAHLIYHFGVGGMENGLVNLINNMPESRYRHAILCITGYSDFRKRLRREFEVIAIDKVTD